MADGNAGSARGTGTRRGRPRPFLFLIGAIVAVIVAVAGGLVYLDRTTSPISGFQAVTPAPLFPDLGAQPEAVAEIGIQGPGPGFTIRRTENGWGMADKADYPVEEQRAQGLIERVAGLNALYVSRASQPQYREYGVAGPEDPGDRSVHLSFRDDSGNLIAGLRVGQSMTVPGGDSLTKAFIRRDDDPRIWLADRELSVVTSELDWLHERILDVSRERIVEMTIEPPRDRRLVIRRQQDGQLQVVEGLEANQQVRTEAAVDIPLSALERLLFEDVLPAEAFDQAGAPEWTAVMVRDDGMEYRATLYPKADGNWAVLDAGVAGDGDAGAHPAAQEAARFRSLHEPWVYRLPLVSAAKFMTRVSDLTD